MLLDPSSRADLIMSLTCSILLFAVCLVPSTGGDLWLHETVVAWFCGQMRRTKPQVLPWEETRTQWAARAQRCVRAINAEYNVASLCAEFLDRLQACMDHGGERLAK